MRASLAFGAQCLLSLTFLLAGLLVLFGGELLALIATAGGGAMTSEPAPVAPHYFSGLIVAIVAIAVELILFFSWRAAIRWLNRLYAVS